MNILALDTSSMAASCALLDEDRPLGEFYTDAKLTHSQTIMPMVQALLRCSQAKLSALDLFAVSVGPGSFTGLRIGVAAVKGMAQTLGKPCFAVSTLEGLAYNLLGRSGLVCAALDARCGQVYAALFDLDAGLPLVRLSKDAALLAEDLCDSLAKEARPVTLVGDGAALCLETMAVRHPEKVLAVAGKALLLQHASSVGLAAFWALKAGKTPAISADELAPSYLKLPQAQRELAARCGAPYHKK